jgi:hypothetical protein
MNLKSEVSRLKNDVNKLAYATRSGTDPYAPRFIDPEVIEAARHLLNGGAPDEVPRELREQSLVVRDAAEILDGLMNQ